MTTRDSKPSAAQQASTHPTPSHPDTGRPTGRAAVPQAEPNQASTGFLRRRLEARAKRRTLAGRQRVVHRVEMLGPHWHIVDYHPDDPDFLAIGPGRDLPGDGLPTMAGRGWSWPATWCRSTASARRTSPWPGGTPSGSRSRCPSWPGRRIPVVPVVAFLGTGQIVYYGRPPARVCGHHVPGPRSSLERSRQPGRASRRSRSC